MQSTQSWRMPTLSTTSVSTTVFWWSGAATASSPIRCVRPATRTLLTSTSAPQSSSKWANNSQIWFGRSWMPPKWPTKMANSMSSLTRAPSMHWSLAKTTISATLCSGNAWESPKKTGRCCWLPMVVQKEDARSFNPPSLLKNTTTTNAGPNSTTWAL